MANRSPWKFWLAQILFGAVMLMAGAGACMIFEGIRVSLYAENALHATLFTIELVEDYVKRHDGQWPGSWNDLEAVPALSSSKFAWPQQSDELQKYVSIDFAADPIKISQQSADEFEAIRTVGPHYPYKDCAQLQSLLQTLRTSAL